jgi:hypothetical protein
VDFDQAVAELISKTDGANRTAEIAMAWVERMSDPNLKYESLALVLSQWNQSDPPAAQNYLAHTSWLEEQKRQELLKRLRDASPGIAASGNE